MEGAEWCHCMAPLSQVSLSLRGPWGVAQCHYCCMAPSVTGVTVPTWSLGCDTVSLSLHGPWGITQCHRGCTVPLVSHSAAVQPCSIAQRHCCSLGCHMVSLSPRSAQGVTVTAGLPGARQCHCSSCGLSHGVTVSARCMGCHIVLCHCMAHGVSPSVTITAWPGVSHTVTAQDTPQCRPLRIPWAVTQCRCAPPGCLTPRPHRLWGTPGTAQRVPAAQVPATPNPTSPWGDTSRSPSPPPTQPGRTLLPGEQPFPITHQPAPSAGL